MAISFCVRRKFMRFVKLLSVSLAAGFILAALAFVPSKLCFENGESYTFFCGDSSKNCREVAADRNAGFKKLTLKDVCGECTVYKSFNLEEYLEKVNGEVKFVEELSDSVNYYCTADLPYSVNLYGEEINLHVCIKDSGVKVASPIIFGGY